MFQCFNVSMFQCFNVSTFQRFNVSMFQRFNVSMFQCFNFNIIECQHESKSAACNTFLWIQCHQALVLRVFFLYYALLNKEPCQLTHRRRQAVLQVSSLELCWGNTYTCRRSLFRTLRISLGLSCLCGLCVFVSGCVCVLSSLLLI